MKRRTARRRIWSIEGERVQRQQDLLAVEEPLEMQLQAGSERRTLAVTMRTPGNDYELTAGFLYGEGVIHSRHDFVHMTYCVADSEQQEYNTLSILLRRPALPELPQLERHFYTNSACGICGTTYIEQLEDRALPAIDDALQIAGDVLFELPTRLRRKQAIFDSTGGLHAAALFDRSGALIELREDVGRHNALDKLIGWGVLNDKLPFSQHILLVSGRASYELLQKAVVAGIPVVCAVSAPSSLAVSVAQRFNVTLIGFLRDKRLNVYTHPQRIAQLGF